jgi:prepilin signal peptidase PulO-like enzyme (type II secretory pathway)
MNNFFDLAFLGGLFKFSSMYTKKRNTILLLQILGSISNLVFWILEDRLDIAIITALSVFSGIHSSKSLKGYYYWLIPFTLVYITLKTSVFYALIGLIPFWARGGENASIIKSRFVLCYIYYIAFCFYYSYFSILMWSTLNLIMLLYSYKKDNWLFSLNYDSRGVN